LTKKAAMTVKALFFDVFGTLVDFRTGVAREAESILGAAGHHLDWLAFADTWRNEYQPALEDVRAGRRPFCKLDVLHRENLDRILPRFAVSGLAEEPARNLNLAWHRLPAWPDVPGGLARLKRRFLLAPVSNGNISLMVDLRPPQRLSVGRDPGCGSRRRLQTQAARLSRRLRGFRSAARRVHDGGRAHE
jgi:2-haloacid dehalogenase